MNINSGVPWVSKDGITRRTLEIFEIRELANMLANINNMLNETLALSKNSRSEINKRFTISNLKEKL